MRQRDRDRVAAQARELCADESPEAAARLVVIWARDLPDLWGVAHVYRPHRGPDQAHDLDMLICETRWRDSDNEACADTIAHELAHVIVWARDLDAVTHGAKWRACFRRLRAIAVEMEWR